MKSVLQKIKNITNANEVNSSDLKEILFAILENYPVGQRNPKHIGLISQALLTIEFFKKLEEARGEDSIRLCALQLKYEKHQNNTNIITHGERGICEIHVPNSQGQFVKVGELKAGQSFGELALINDSPRRATIKAQTDCDLAILSKQDYIKIIADMEEREIKKKIQFMESLPLFNQIHRRAMHEYIYYFKIVSYKWKDSVYQMNEEPQFVYIIKSGEFILQKFSRVEKSQNSGIFPITAQVAILGPGEIFGEVDCLLNEKRHFSVSCHSQTAELFIISRKHFVERVMDNYNIREKNFVENYLNRKILWRNERMNNIKTVKKIAENDIRLGSSKLSPIKRSKKESIQYDQNQTNEIGSQFSSPQKSKRSSQGFNFMITEISDISNPSMIVGGNNSPGSFSYLGKQNQRQINLRSITTATPQLSKRASSAFPTSKGKNDIKSFFSQPDHQSIGTIEESPQIIQQQMNEEEDERSLKENSSNLANSSLLDALIFSSPLKNKFNQSPYVKLKDLPQIQMNPGNQRLVKRSGTQNYSNTKEGIPEINYEQEYDGMRKFLKTNSAVYKMRKLNQAKLEICKQQNIDVQGKSFKNIGIIEDVELPKYVLNKLKNQNALMSNIQRGQSPKVIGSTTGSQIPQTAYSSIASPQKKRSVSNNNYHHNQFNNSIMPNINSTKNTSNHNNSFENEFQKISSALSAPLQRVENEKLKSMITQVRYIDSMQYKVQTQLQEKLNQNVISGNKSLIVTGNREDSVMSKQPKFKRSVSPMSTQNKNSSVIMHKLMIGPYKHQDHNSSSVKPNSQYTIHWDHSPEPNSPPLIPNPHVNLPNFQQNILKL